MNIAIRITCKNDTNGNPRRGWIITSPEGAFLGFINEGYAGQAALRGAKANQTGEIEVTPGEFRRLRALPGRVA